jgi:hypothetical protein
MKRLEIGSRLKHLAAKMEALRPPCPIGDWTQIYTYYDDQPVPEVPTCPQCGKFHGVIVREIVIRGREDVDALNAKHGVDFREPNPVIDKLLDNLTPPAGSPVRADPLTGE